MERTDEEIAALVQKGDDRSFGILVERYEKKLMRYARRFLFQYADAEDLVQDVLIKAYANIQSFDIKRRFSPWIYRIAHNTFINAIKKRGQEPISLFDVDTLFPHLALHYINEEKFEEKELRETLENGLKKLDPKYREPIVLYHFEELGYKEIAEVLRIPVATVGVRIKRGREALKRLLENHGRKP